MKLDKNDHKVETGGVTGSKDFTITTNSKAFRVLSDNLYSNKIRAVIRELSCNAYDAHRAVGVDDRPFEITLPTRFSSMFVIRDFGPGMDDDEITNLYTNYFASSKNASNEYVGCLGLGSKSPFAYVDSFTITSYQNGKETVYTAFVNEDGFPSISKMGVMDSTEETGFKVSCCVKKDDFYEFRNEVEKTVKWFPVSPIIHGDDRVKILKPEFGFMSPDGTWGIKKLNTTHMQSTAVMGFIEYGLEKIPNDQLTRSHIDLLSYGVILHFDIGELDIAASREYLSFSGWCVKNIIKKLDGILEEMKVEVEAGLTVGMTDYEKCKHLYSGVCGKYGLGLINKVFIKEYGGASDKISQTIANNTFSVSDFLHAYVYKYEISDSTYTSVKRKDPYYNGIFRFDSKHFTHNPAIIIRDTGMGHAKFAGHLHDHFNHNEIICFDLSGCEDDMVPVYIAKIRAMFPDVKLTSDFLKSIKKQKTAKVKKVRDTSKVYGYKRISFTKNTYTTGGDYYSTKTELVARFELNEILEKPKKVLLLIHNGNQTQMSIPSINRPSQACGLYVQSHQMYDTIAHMSKVGGFTPEDFVILSVIPSIAYKLMKKYEDIRYCNHYLCGLISTYFKKEVADTLIQFSEENAYSQMITHLTSGMTPPLRVHQVMEKYNQKYDKAQKIKQFLRPMPFQIKDSLCELLQAEVITMEHFFNDMEKVLPGFQFINTMYHSNRSDYCNHLFKVNA